MSTKWIFALAVVLLVVIGLDSTLYTVEPTEQVLITQFGKPVRVVDKPGLYAKLPFIQTAIMFDKRLLDATLPGEEVILGDQRRLIVDSFARFRITSPLKYYQSIGGTESGIRGRLDAVVSSALRQVLGDIPLADLLSRDRDPIMAQIRDEANRQMAGFGIKVVDVRIRRADLPAENTDAVLKRMQAGRERIAALARADGAEESQKIHADADKTVTVLVAQAKAKASALEGQGEAKAIDIYAKSFSQDPNFYRIWRTLQAYRHGLAGANTNLVLTPGSGFLQYLTKPPTSTAMPPP
ncbi:MAG: protease modulator HflC [Rhodospirillales bacterium 20-60-12]|nr:MAG: protease modulator HflC [Rhodospirillales bacterium 20-60-12]